MNAPSPSLKPMTSFQRHGLISRWHMLELDASNFHKVITSLRAAEAVLEERDLCGHTEGRVNWPPFLEKLKLMEEPCHALGAKNTLVAITRYIHAFRNFQTISWSDAYSALKDIRERFQDELNNSALFGLNSEEAMEYHNTIGKFNFNVCDKFCSKVGEDIEEAGKCLALDRNTACVFHLMRAMEQVLKHLASKLEIENVDKEWGKLLSDIDGKIQAMPKGKERDEWSECRANLYHVKQAWRNSTMHPKETYTNGQARDVLRAVRAFMEQLATLV